MRHNSIGILHVALTAGMLLFASSAFALTFIESGGVIVGEAEDFTRRTAAGDGTTWKVVTSEVGVGAPGQNNVAIANARGNQYIQILPDNGGAGGGPTNAPSVEYDMVINTLGTYQLFLNWETDTPVGNSDSMFVDIVQLKDGPGGTIADHYEMVAEVAGRDQDFSTGIWDGGGQAEVNSAGAANNPITFDITSAGTYTLRLSEREDGAAVDAFVFQLDGLTDPNSLDIVSQRPFTNPDVLLHYNFEPTDQTNDNLVSDSAGQSRPGTLESIVGGSFSFEANTPTQIAGTQSLNLDGNGGAGAGDAARVVRNIGTGELDLSDESWTVSTWFNRADDSSNLDFVFHLGAGDGFGGGNELYLVSDGTSIELEGFFDGTRDIEIKQSGLVELGEWFHAAVVHDAIAGTMGLYLDGVLIGEDNSFGLNLSQAGDSLVIGGHDSTTFQTARWFNGNIDDFTIYRQALRAENINRLANGANPLTGGIVPEPTTATLALLGTIGLVGRRRRHA